jgi:hypothetical protein
MLKLTLTSSLSDPNKDTPFFAREETTNLKYNGDSEKKLENIMDQFMLLLETPSRRSTSCQSLIGLPKFGPRNSRSLSCKLATTTLT